MTNDFENVEFADATASTNTKNKPIRTTSYGSIDVLFFYRQELARQAKEMPSPAEEKSILVSMSLARREILLALCEIPDVLQTFASWYANDGKKLFEGILETSHIVTSSATPTSSVLEADNATTTSIELKERIKDQAHLVVSLCENLNKDEVRVGAAAIDDPQNHELRRNLVEAISTIRPKDALIKKLVNELRNSDGSDSYAIQIGRISKAQSELAEKKSTLIHAYLKLGERVARHVWGKARSLQLADFIQEANMGLLDAVDKFDGWSKCSFATYAGLRMEGNIMDFLRSQHGGMRGPRGAKRLRSEIQALEQELQRPPTLSEIATHSERSINEVSFLLAASQPVTSLHAELEENIRDFGPEPLAILEAAERSVEIKQSIANLNPREQKVVRTYFGIDDVESLNLKAIGAEAGVSESRICQILASVRNKMRSRMELESGTLVNSEKARALVTAGSVVCSRQEVPAAAKPASAHDLDDSNVKPAVAPEPQRNLKIPGGDFTNCALAQKIRYKYFI